MAILVMWYAGDMLSGNFKGNYSWAMKINQLSLVEMSSWCINEVYWDMVGRRWEFTSLSCGYLFCTKIVATGIEGFFVNYGKLHNLLRNFTTSGLWNLLWAGFEGGIRNIEDGHFWSSGTNGKLKYKSWKSRKLRKKLIAAWFFSTISPVSHIGVCNIWNNHSIDVLPTDDMSQWNDREASAKGASWQ